MAFTDNCDIFGSVHEEGINRILRHIMQQRPSLFNYATRTFHENEKLFCHPIQAAKTVRDSGNPLFTEQDPLPIFGAPVPIGLNFCLQLTDLEIDFHPTSAFELPEQLGGELAQQRFALRTKVCAGVACPSDELVDRLIPALERLAVAGQRRDIDQAQKPETAHLSAAAASQPTQESNERLMSGMFAPTNRSAMMTNLAMFDSPVRGANIAGGINRQREPIALPSRELLCFCLELFIVGHFEWGTVIDPNQQWLKPRLDGIEIVDLQPTPMENAIECYAATIMRLGILPRLILPMETLVLDVTKVMQKQGVSLGKQITLGPSVVPTDVPNNPAIEEDMVKAFIKLTVTP